MDLQIAVFLLFVLFTGGHSFSCFQCANLTDSCSLAVNCTSGVSNCLSATTTDTGSNAKLNVKGCAASASCANGTVNFGVAKLSAYCCNTDQCNAQDAVLSNVTTGRSCFVCAGSNCTNSVNCTGTEDRCIKGTGTFGNQTGVLKGCVSKSLCDASASIFSTLQSVTCCEGNLCNAAQSVSQSFLFLCCSLISYFLLH